MKCKEASSVRIFITLFILIVSTLNHNVLLSDKEAIGTIASGLKAAIRNAVKLKINSIALPLMTGGWRLNISQAVVAINNAIEMSSGDCLLKVYILEKDKYEEAQSYFSSMGW